MRVLETGGDLDLAQEPVGAERDCKLGAQDLQGDGAAVSQVLGEVDRRHPTATELVLDRVAPGEGGLQAGQLIHVEGSQARAESIIGRRPGRS